MIIVLGLILLGIAVAFGVDVAVENDFKLDVTTFHHVWSVGPGVILLAGVATGIVGSIGLVLFVRGIRRARRDRTELRSAVAERDRLAHERDEQLRLREREAARAAPEAGPPELHPPDVHPPEPPTMPPSAAEDARVYPPPVHH